MFRAIGLMSGTSLDGVDAAWLETDGERIAELGPVAGLEYEDGLRTELRRLLELAPKLTPDDPLLRDAEQRLTRDHALAVGLLGLAADVIGFHGQTILHAPERGVTWQIGDAAQLAKICRIPVVHDFRGADIAAGGEGAPLAPLFHAAMAEKLEKPLLIVNIGGVANMTFLGPGGEILACDTGPGNGPLDDLAARVLGEKFDRDGALAASGKPETAHLEKLFAHPFFARQGPKSLDRLSFSARIDSAIAGLSPADAAATLAEFCAGAIALAGAKLAPKRVLVCGGGRKNLHLMARLAEKFGVPVVPVEAAGWNGDALEAQCFGYLAVRALRGLPLSLPGTTGVSAPMPGGRLALPPGSPRAGPRAVSAAGRKLP